MSTTRQRYTDAHRIIRTARRLQAAEAATEPGTPESEALKRALADLVMPMVEIPFQLQMAAYKAFEGRTHMNVCGFDQAKMHSATPTYVDRILAAGRREDNHYAWRRRVNELHLWQTRRYAHVAAFRPDGVL